MLTDRLPSTPLSCPYACHYGFSACPLTHTLGNTCEQPVNTLMDLLRGPPAASTPWPRGISSPPRPRYTSRLAPSGATSPSIRSTTAITGPSAARPGGRRHSRSTTGSRRPRTDASPPRVRTTGSSSACPSARSHDCDHWPTGERHLQASRSYRRPMPRSPPKIRHHSAPQGG